VPPLAVPGTDADLTAISQAEAVRLFAERAAVVKPEFAVTAENAAPVAAFVRRLDGIALAIELAAARIAAMTSAELARRLERSFAVLGVGGRGEVAHHQTLRATIDWSYQLLGEPEQRLLSRLSVFAGGCTLEAAETVCGGDGIEPDTVFELLASLVARSLVVAEECGPETRYRLLETIRQYGQERLTEARETDRWQARHADYYADVLKQIRHHDRRTDVFWAVRLRTEQDNLLAAWFWAIDTRNVDTAFSILAGFAPREFAFRWPLLLDGGAALELPRAAAHPGYPLALAVSAMFASNRGHGHATEELCRRAAEANERRNPPAGGSRKSSATPAETSRFYRRVRRRQPPRRTGRRHRPDRWRPRRRLPPARPHRERLRTRPATRPGRSRWPARRLHWPGRSAIRRSSPAACSPSAGPSPTLTPTTLVPVCARASSSAQRSAIKAPSMSGPPGSHFL